MLPAAAGSYPKRVLSCLNIEESRASIVGITILIWVIIPMLILVLRTLWLNGLFGLGQTSYMFRDRASSLSGISVQLATDAALPTKLHSDHSRVYPKSLEVHPNQQREVTQTQTLNPTP